MNAVRETVAGHGAPELIGFHKLRARRAGSRRYVDLHLRDGTSLRRAHEISHELQRAIALRLRGADVLIHREPQEAADRRARLQPGARNPG
jgi:divalent metal cation (Fe/Co/Zn/Cd) transporter